MKIISEFSLWIIFPMALLAIAASVYFYRKNDWLSSEGKWKKYLLIVLRSSSIFTLLLLLLGLTMQYILEREEKPLFIVLVDNSLSMKNYKDSNLVLKQTNQLINGLRSANGANFDYEVITCGSSIGDKGINFDEKKSNLEEGFKFINSQYYNRNIGGIAFISDGNFNTGSSPIYAAEKISLTPIFSLAVGDTIPKKDHLIKHVSVNDVAFLANDFPVEVDISSFQFPGRTAQVSVFHDGKKVGSQSITYGTENGDYQPIKFLIPATKVGFQRYVVELSALNEEYTLINNTKSFYVEVMDTRSKVLILSHAPHPDIAAFRQALETNDNLEIINKTFANWDKKLDKVDLVVIHEPGINYPKEIMSAIVNKGIPQVFIIGSGSTGVALNSLSLGISFENSNQTDDVQGQVNASFNAFELSEGIKSAIEFFPPLRSKFGSLKTGGNTETLLFQRIGQVVKVDPLIFFMQQKQIRNGFIYGEGIWRWRLNEYLRSGSHIHFNELFNKIANYVMVKQEGMGLRVTLNKRFTTDESIIFNASFYNASLEAIITPKISLSLLDQNGKKYTSQFGVNGEAYKLDYGKLTKGKYQWNASCVFNGKKYSKSGTFLVEEIDFEKTEITANHEVLKQLSNQSNGKFYELANQAKFIEELKTRDDIVIITREELSFKSLIQLIPILIFLSLTLSIEWFIRRWSGAY